MYIATKSKLKQQVAKVEENMYGKLCEKLDKKEGEMYLDRGTKQAKMCCSLG